MPLRAQNFSARVILALSATMFFASLAASQTAITTYHVDNNRTGWNSHETVLTPANVGSSSFGLLKGVPLDDQVDGQPLFVPAVNITAGSHQGVHDVVYVATEGNTIYAIDAEAGTILLKPNFGKPVGLPLGCTNNGPNVGINSTPVIDLTSNTLYVLIYTRDSTGPAYRIHALDLGSLTDKVTPQPVVASHTLTDGTTFNFNATYQRQRPGLLLANGTVYAGFGSFCDFAANVSRGLLLGWSTGSLTPLPANQVFVNRQHIIIGRCNRFDFHSVQSQFIQGKIEAVRIARFQEKPAFVFVDRDLNGLLGGEHFCRQFTRPVAANHNLRRMLLDLAAHILDLTFGYDVTVAQKDNLIGDDVDFVKNVAGNDDVATLRCRRTEQRNHLCACEGIQPV